MTKGVFIFFDLFIIFLGFQKNSFASYQDLEGVWEHYSDNCYLFVQFKYRNYIAYKTGPNCAQSIGAYMGVYAEVQGNVDQVVITFASVPVGDTTIPRSVVYDYEMMTGDELRLTGEINGYPVDVMFNRRAAGAFDGVWDGSVSGGSLKLRTEFESGMYLSHTYEEGANGELLNTRTFLGIILPNANDMTKYDILYAEAADLPRGDFGQQIGVDVTVNAGGLTIAGTGYTATFTGAASASPIDGFYSSYQAPCFLAFEIDRGLFRSYNVGPSASCQHAAFLGVNNVDTTTSEITVGYGFTAFQTGNATFAGLSRTYDYTVNSAANTLQLQGTGPSNTAVDITVYKITAPMTTTQIILRLNADFGTYGFSNLVKDLKALGNSAIDGDKIAHNKTTAGSVVVSFYPLGETQTEIDAFATALQSQTMIGSNEVLSVTIPDAVQSTQMTTTTTTTNSETENTTPTIFISALLLTTFIL